MPFRMEQITIDLKRMRDDSYTVYIAPDVLDHLETLTGGYPLVDRYIVISDSMVNPLYGDRVAQMLSRSGLPVDRIEIPAGEASKSMATVPNLVGNLIALNATRQSFLIALGGGVVGDLTGFIASIFMRGIDYMQIATSLIAQVDSSLGGKTGVDTPDGKNLVGTFHHPKAVLIDPVFLKTLPEGEFQNGLSEVIKYAIISDQDLFDLLTTRAAEIVAREIDLMQHLVARSCKIKAQIVEADEKEGNLRRILNFGHTVGHALEALSAYTLSHGEAVATGMVAAALMSQKLGHLDRDVYHRIVTLIRSYQLPTTISPDSDTQKILQFMAHDKKVAGRRLHWVLISRVGRPFVTPEVPERIVRETLEELKQ